MLKIGESSTFGEILNELQGGVDRAEIRNLGWLFLPKGQEWTIDTMAIFGELEEVPPELDLDDEAEIPQIAKDKNMRPTLDAETILDIIYYLRGGIGNERFDQEILFKAFMYYWQHDAFADEDQLA